MSCPTRGKYGAKLPSSRYYPPEAAKIIFRGETNLHSLKASDIHELWPFRTIAFHLLAGRYLLQSNKENNLVKKQKNELMGLNTLYLA